MRRARIFLFLLVAAAVWLPALHLFYGIGALERGRLVRAMADHTSPTSTRTAPMRAVNPEWDFMQRTYSVLGLANLARRPGVTEAERAAHLARIDAIIDDTIATDTSLGAKYFLLPYANERPFVDPESRSLFVDGEIVMMIAARELVERRPEILDEARTRAARVARTMSRSPSLSAESYPDDCWTFCNTTALAGLVTLDRVTGDDHGALARAWVAYAKEHLVDAPKRNGTLCARHRGDPSRAACVRRSYPREHPHRNAAERRIVRPRAAARAVHVRRGPRLARARDRRSPRGLVRSQPR